jgi:hypothetical protein
VTSQPLQPSNIGLGTLASLGLDTVWFWEGTGISVKSQTLNHQILVLLGLGTPVLSGDLWLGMGT